MTFKNDQEVWVIEIDGALWAGRIAATSMTSTRRHGAHRMVSVALGIHAYWYHVDQVFTTYEEALAECKRRRAVQALTDLP